MSLNFQIPTQTLPSSIPTAVHVCLFVCSHPPPPRLIEQGVVGTTYSGTQYNEEPNVLQMSVFDRRPLRTNICKYAK